MKASISTNYRELLAEEVAGVAKECNEAWKDPEIPMRQYALAARDELEAFNNGLPVAPFDALVRCIRKMPADVLCCKPRLLDVGASGGYYSDVLTRSGFNFQYTAIDFSPAFKKLAESLYPEIEFQVGDARALPFHDDEFDVVLNGATIMHVREYEQVIRETARTAFRYVVFHRTPVSTATRFWRKEAYGVPCLEIWFGESELLWMFEKYGLQPVYSTEVFRDGDFAHKSYLLRKALSIRHHSV